jgi:hypothetical protein
VMGLHSKFSLMPQIEYFKKLFISLIAVQQARIAMLIHWKIKLDL